MSGNSIRRGERLYTLDIVSGQATSGDEKKKFQGKVEDANKDYTRRTSVRDERRAKIAKKNVREEYETRRKIIRAVHRLGTSEDGEKMREERRRHEGSVRIAVRTRSREEESVERGERREERGDRPRATTEWHEPVRAAVGGGMEVGFGGGGGGSRRLLRGGTEGIRRQCTASHGGARGRVVRAEGLKGWILRTAGLEAGRKDRGTIRRSVSTPSPRFDEFPGREDRFPGSSISRIVPRGLPASRISTTPALPSLKAAYLPKKNINFQGYASFVGGIAALSELSSIDGEDRPADHPNPFEKPPRPAFGAFLIEFIVLLVRQS
ncbi:hypothetical protein KM043_014669 [Ampulex compressa]|nr:hypothetical protein KM043_014669 [Ampulex compressa]